MAFRLRVVTPTRLVVDADVTELTAPGSAGQFGVLEQHVTFLGQIVVGLIEYVEDGTAKSVLVHGGYTEVLGDVVTVLADEAEFPGEIDVAAAREDLERIGVELADEVEDNDRVASLLAEQKKAQLRASTGKG